MAKIKILGEAAVVTSAISYDVLKKLKKYSPAELTLTKETKDSTEIIFATNVGETQSFTKFGVVFNAKSTTGAAQATFQIPSGVEDKIAYIKDTFGFGILNLNKLEAKITEAHSQLNEQFITMEESIVEVE